jgi:hypothetical protein
MQMRLALFAAYSFWIRKQDQTREPAKRLIARIIRLSTWVGHATLGLLVTLVEVNVLAGTGNALLLLLDKSTPGAAARAQEISERVTLKVVSGSELGSLESSQDTSGTDVGGEEPGNALI